jgi:hypothetical protein
MAQSVKILCKDGFNLYVTIRGNKAVLAPEDPDDEMQVMVCTI